MPEFLGNSLADIAAEKAGIVKPGVPLIVGPQDDAPRDVILRRADALGAPVSMFGQDFFAHQEHGRMVYQDLDGLLDLPLPRLVGRHQIENAARGHCRSAGASAAIGRKDHAIEQGLRTVEWPARLQRLTRGPLIDSRARRRRNLARRRAQSAWRRGRGARHGRFRGARAEAALSDLRDAEDQGCRRLSVRLSRPCPPCRHRRHSRRRGQPRRRRLI